MLDGQKEDIIIYRSAFWEGNNLIHEESEYCSTEVNGAKPVCRHLLSLFSYLSAKNMFGYLLVTISIKA